MVWLFAQKNVPKAGWVNKNEIYLSQFWEV